MQVGILGEVDGPKLRRAQRIPVNLTVHVIASRQHTTYNTVDVSRVGLFIHTDEPRPERQLVRLRIEMGNGDPLEAHGMVVRAIPPAEASREGIAPGMGIEFYGFSGDPRRRWESYLTALTAAYGRVRQGQRPATWPPRYTSVAGGKDRVLPDETVLLLPVCDIEALFDICESDIPRGTTFVPAPGRLPIGCSVCLRIVHPTTHEVYDLHGKVMQLHGDPQFPGIPLVLRPGVQVRREQFLRFVEKGLPASLACPIEDA